MALNATNFVVKGPIKSADMLQFVNLFTGVMTDQPVTFRNAVTIGGNQGTNTAPLSLYGSAGQTSNLLNLYPSTASANPTWGIAALGQHSWGAGSPVVLDTFLSRVATQNGHATDTAGLLIQPYAEVNGPIQATSFQFSNGTALSSTSPLQLTLNQDLQVNRNILVGTNAAPPLIHTFTTARNQGMLIESPSDFVNVAGKAAVGLTGNAYFDGTNWQRYDITNSAMILQVLGGQWLLQSAPSGANPISAWTNVLQIMQNGQMNIGPGSFPPTIRANVNYPSRLEVAAPGPDGSGQAILGLSGRNSVQLTANAYFDGTNWVRYDTSNPAMLLNHFQSTLNIMGAAPGANPISWTSLMSLNYLGALTLPNGSINTAMLAAGTVTGVANFQGNPAFSLATLGAWTATPITVSLTVTAGGPILVCVTTNLSHTAANANILTGLGLDGLINISLGQITFAPANSIIATTFTYVFSAGAIGVGTHSITFFLQNNTAGTLILYQGTSQTMSAIELRR